MTKEEREDELMRRELWIKAATSVVTRYDWNVATSWANKMLEEYDKKFNEIKIDNQEFRGQKLSS